MALLEFSVPERSFAGRAYLAHYRGLLPRIGDFLWRRPGAYRYLRDTVLIIPRGLAFGALPSRAGLEDPRQVLLTARVVSLWVARKPSRRDGYWAPDAHRGPATLDPLQERRIHSERLGDSQPPRSSPMGGLPDRRHTGPSPGRSGPRIRTGRRVLSKARVAVPDGHSS
ncbi:MAG: hypothetical protein FJW35_18110 [Acidobacteria bacterium]|nr:hypothetical protein [Acidobacteriota bacterium]